MRGYVNSPAEGPPAAAGGLRRRRAETAAVVLLASAAAWFALSGNLGSEFWWNDAARHAMDGVFVLDFVRDLPGSLGLYRYATEYYARYPCLGLVHYPPVFPAVEALFFAVCGVSVETARATVAAFAALGAVFSYLVGRRFLGPWGAAVSTLLFITAPGVVYWSRGVMLETPVMAMMLVSSYWFLAYVEDERRGAGVAAAAFLTLAILTKQTACSLVPVWLVYGVWRRGWRVLWRRESLLGMGLAAVLLVPFAVATVLFSPLNVGQSVGSLTGDFSHSRWSLASVGFYTRWLPRHAGVVCVVLIGCLVVAGLARRVSGRSALGSVERLRGVVYATLWAATCYVLFTFVIANKEGRFVLTWAPALALLGASGASLLALGGRPGRAAAATVGVVLAAQALACGGGWRHDPWSSPSPHVAGTAVAAHRMADLPGGTVVFYAGRFNGNFIFNVRRFDGARKIVVLRGSKLLFSTPAMQAHGLTVHAATGEKILDVLRDYGVRYVLVEEPTPTLDRVGPVLDELRELARSPLFVRRAVYAIPATDAALARRLLLYERIGAGPARADVLTINLPLSGRVIRVPLRRLGVETMGLHDAGASGGRP